MVTEGWDDLVARIERLEARTTAAPGGVCSAELPHPNKLVYVRRSAGSGQYMCECGQVYEKDGGRLREVR